VVEKNPGLFVLAAYEILQHYPFACFVVIGDGQLKRSLIQLTQRLDIEWAFDFKGWVNEELPKMLLDLDLVINPSLRGWSETFCISNIEVMSLGIPLITFAVGGFLIFLLCYFLRTTNFRDRGIC
jgi:glycosyltransferase involved in cell wall biosynthesis